ncbi:TPA: hypothetical protein N0F65_000194 [Lagenidium giganteum]|uniref:EGF-like domain-containing protein n=1 Tax=Lagenidium giganteum TaxID=4803 RepID=A0AAV2YDT7_9STRA|nr:TPA: hypothetical protein N0F65_000194 [Lagenidium giganteum]
MLGNCNGHGRCNTATKTCSCMEGYGAPTDVAVYKTPDCSLRTCPSGPSWFSIPTAANSAGKVMECSGAGFCDRNSGQCKCLAGFEGADCQRASCPNGCSGHGRCFTMSELATLTQALPLSAPTTYGGAVTTTTWDQDRVQGCVCDSSWDVGLGANQRQTPQYFGADCSLMHCPSGNDPMTAVDETDCSGVTAPGGVGVGLTGNICHVDCSNRGICDYSSGTCRCFDGFYGSNCASLSPVT